MGHCNNVALASPSPVEQAVKIEQFLRAILQPAGSEGEKTQAAASVNLNVNIQAGVSIMGSKNVVAFRGTGDVSMDGIKGDDEPLAGRKRRAESVSLSSCSQNCPSKRTLITKEQEPAHTQTTLGKKVKVEAAHGE